jgi:hypothetical protein
LALTFKYPRIEAGSRAPLLAGVGWAQVEKILKRAGTSK